MDKSFVKKMEALKGHPIDDLKGPLQAINEALHSTVVTTLTSIFDEGACENLGVLSENWRSMADFATLPCPPSLIKSLCEKVQGVVASFNRYQLAKNKSNLNGFVRCWLAFKDWKLPATAQCDQNKEILRAALVGLQAASGEHKQIIETVAVDSLEVLKECVRKVAKYATGARDGSSWKEGLAEGASVKEVLDHAALPKKGLLSGPGSLVAEAKRTILEAE